MLTPSPQDSKGQRRHPPARTAAKPLRAASPSQTRPESTFHNLKALIAKRAYERHAEQGYRHGFALDDWLEAEREILSQVPPV